MSLSVDPVKSYADMAKTIAVACALMLLTGALFMGGWALGRHQMDAKLAAKDKALLSASTSLDAAADALNAVNAEAKRRIDQAKADKRAADVAAAVAADAERAARADLASYEQRQQKARANPDCASLQDTHLGKVCGL